MNLKHVLFVFVVFLYFYAQGQSREVLFIGNSYTHMNDLSKIFKNLANSKGKNVSVDTLAVSGSTLEGHTLRPNTYQKIRAKNWDYVFIQGFSSELSYDSLTISQKTIPYAQLLIDSIKKYNPCVSVFYYMTWGYANGFKEINVEDNYKKMQLRIEKGYIQMSKETGNHPIAPVGMVWNIFRDKYPSINLYAPDNAHPSPYGSYLAACSFYTSIFNQSSIGGVSPISVEKSVAENIQKTAFEFVQSNRSTYFLENIQEINVDSRTIDFNVDENWLSVNLIPKITDADFYHWEFGDGKTSNAKMVKYYYEKPGTYTIRLRIESGCSRKSVSKTVKVSNKIRKGNSH